PLPPTAIFSTSCFVSQLSFSGRMGPRDPGGTAAHRAALTRSGRRSCSSPMGRLPGLRPELLLELDEGRVLLSMVVEEGDPGVEALVRQVVPLDHQVHGPGPALAEGLPHPAVGDLGQPRVAGLIPAGARPRTGPSCTGPSCTGPPCTGPPCTG